MYLQNRQLMVAACNELFEKIFSNRLRRNNDGYL